MMPRTLALLAFLIISSPLPSQSQVPTKQEWLESVGTADFCFTPLIREQLHQENTEIARKLQAHLDQMIDLLVSKTGITVEDYQAYAYSGYGSGLFSMLVKEHGGCKCLVSKLISKSPFRYCNKN